VTESSKFLGYKNHSSIYNLVSTGKLRQYSIPITNKKVFLMEDLVKLNERRVQKS
jgi:hypothetical protein